MNPIIKIVGVIILILAVLVYTVVNYLSGKLDLGVFIVSLALLAYVLTGMVNQLVQYLKNKH